MKIVKRDGKIVDYNPDKIRIAIGKANNEVAKKERATDEEIDDIIKYIEDLKKNQKETWEDTVWYEKDGITYTPAYAKGVIDCVLGPKSPDFFFSSTGQKLSLGVLSL